MKNYRLLFILGIAALPLLSGCPSRKSVSTTINTDGSCRRVVGDFDPSTFKGVDSVKHNLPIPVDNTWHLETINDTTAVLVKEFRTVNDLNESYSNDESELRKAKRKVELEKEFRWFHTVFLFQETYQGLVKEMPLSNYLNETEIKMFKSDDMENFPEIAKLDSKARKSLGDNIEERFEYWLHDNIYSMAFDDIIDIADSATIIDRNSIDLIHLKDTIKHQIEEATKKIVSFDFSDNMDMLELAKMIGDEMGLDSSSYQLLSKAVEKADLEERYENELLFGFTNEYDNIVIMPGLLTDTNAGRIEGDSLIWDANPIKYIDVDYTMFAESKVTNRWAYVVSGFIVLLALVIPFLKRIKRSR